MKDPQHRHGQPASADLGLRGLDCIAINWHGDIWVWSGVLPLEPCKEGGFSSLSTAIFSLTSPSQLTRALRLSVCEFFIAVWPYPLSTAEHLSVLSLHCCNNKTRFSGGVNGHHLKIWTQWINTHLHQLRIYLHCFPVIQLFPKHPRLTLSVLMPKVPGIIYPIPLILTVMMVQ